MRVVVVVLAVLLGVAGDLVVATLLCGVYVVVRGSGVVSLLSVHSLQCL